MQNNIYLCFIRKVLIQLCDHFEDVACGAVELYCITEGVFFPVISPINGVDKKTALVLA